MPTKLTFHNWCIFRIATLLIFSSSVASAQMVTHFAGSTSGGGSSDGRGASASFAFLNGIAIDGDGNVVVADPLNATIRRVTPDGAVTTIAGLAGSPGYADGGGAHARFNSPACAAVDSHGNIFVADQGNSTIRKIAAGSGEVTIFAGNPVVYGSSDGTGTSATFSTPEGVAFDGAGNLYVADYFSNTIRKITPAGLVTTLAGTGAGGWADGPATSAQFKGPYGVTVDAAGNVYVSELGNNTIRKVTPDGTVSTLAGSPGVYGTMNGTGSAASFGQPKQLALDGSGNLYVADDGNDLIRKVTPAGAVTTIAGIDSPLARPRGIAIDGHGTVYFSDDYSIRTMSESGANLSRIAGSEPTFGFVDATGGDARFAFPTDVVVDRSHNLFVIDETASQIKKIDSNGAVSTFAGAIQGSLELPRGLTIDSNDNLYFTDGETVRKATPAGVVTTLAGTAGMSGSTDGTGADARFTSPEGIALDPVGNIYVADAGNQTIRKIDSSNVVTTLAGTAGQSGLDDGAGSAARFQSITRMAFGPDGNLYVGDSMRVRVVTPSGNVTTPDLVTSNGSPAGFSEVTGLVFDATGTLWVSDARLAQVAKVTPDGVVTYPVGSSTISGSADGSGNNARFSQGGLGGIALDSGGGLYVADTYNYCIRSIGADLGDRAVIDSSGSKIGVPRQLDTAPQNATAWKWSIYRQPAGSTAALSSTTTRNPTFSPDVNGLYIFQLLSSRGGLKSASTVSLSVDTPRAHAIE